jgi:hypothetical protein
VFGVALGLRAATSATAEENPTLPFVVHVKHLMTAPSDPALWPSFREQLSAWRQEQKKALSYDDRHYRRPEFAWVLPTLCVISP